MKPVARIIAGVIWLLFMPFAHAEGVPVALPESAQVFPVGESIALNGVPMKMRGFHSTESIERLVAWFSRQLGAPVVESRVGRTLVLGKAVEGRYMTVHLETDAGGVRGVVAESDLEAAMELRPRRQEQLDRWLLGLPSGSRVLSDMVSEDHGKRAWYALFENGLDERINSERMRSLMAADGFVLQHEAVGADTSGGSGRAFGEARTLFFKGEGKEAVVTISRNTQRKTAIVINTISALGRYP